MLNFVETERRALGYAGLSGITITMIALSWKGFPYIMGIIAIYLGVQMLINAFQRVDSLTTASVGLVTMAMPVLLSYPYYHTMGFVGTWWEAPAYILLGYVMLSVLMITTRDLPWLLVIGSSIGMAAASTRSIYHLNIDDINELIKRSWLNRCRFSLRTVI